MLASVFNPFSSFHRHFKPLKKLGSGTFGEVYQVRQRSTGAVFVSKTIQKKSVTRTCCHGNQGEELPMEIANLLTLNHHNIIELRGFLETRTKWILLLEDSPNYCDLRRVLREEGAFCESVAKMIYVQVYTAVRFCFSKTIHHRDIKDQNILVNR